jgi:hypothetical protein
LFQAVPQSGGANGHFQVFPTPSLEFVEGQISLRGNPPAQDPVMLFQAGAPVTADLLGPAPAGLTMLFPKTLHAFTTDAKCLQTSPVPSPRSRAAMISCRKS